MLTLKGQWLDPLCKSLAQALSAGWAHQLGSPHSQLASERMTPSQPPRPETPSAAKAALRAVHIITPHGEHLRCSCAHCTGHQRGHDWAASLPAGALTSLLLLCMCAVTGKAVLLPAHLGATSPGTEVPHLGSMPASCCTSPCASTELFMQAGATHKSSAVRQWLAPNPDKIMQMRVACLPMGSADLAPQGQAGLLPGKLPCVRVPRIGTRAGIGSVPAPHPPCPADA